MGKGRRRRGGVKDACRIIGREDQRHGGRRKERKRMKAKGSNSERSKRVGEGDWPVGQSFDVRSMLV